MGFVVPFDGSPLAEAALARAVEFARLLDETVEAVTVLPDGNAAYARERGWLAADADWDRRAVIESLRDRVRAIAPEVDLEILMVDRYAPHGAIAKQLRRHLEDGSTSLVFIGSENAGRLITSISSIGGRVAAGQDYDVVIVRHRSPAAVPGVEEVSPYFEPETPIEPDATAAQD